MPKFCFGRNFDPANIDEMTTADAISHAKTLPGPGYVWQLNTRRKHWPIVGNYGSGKAWNGQAHCVAADPGDWDLLGREGL